MFLDSQELFLDSQELFLDSQEPSSQLYSSPADLGPDIFYGETGDDTMIA